MIKFDHEINLKHVDDESDKLLLLNNNFGRAVSGVLAVQCPDPATFNRAYGSLVSATAEPADDLFTADLSFSSQLFCISATFSGQIRHVVGPRDRRDPCLVLLVRRSGAVTLRVGGTLMPLDVAILSSDTDFTLRACEGGDACSVGWIALKSDPDLVARMPRRLIIPATTRVGLSDTSLSGGVAKRGGRDRLREAGGGLLTWMATGGHREESELAGLLAQLTEAIREQFETSSWADRSYRDSLGWIAGAEAGGRDLIATVQRYLHQHSRDADLTPARLARHCAVSVRKLYNAFAKADLSLRAFVLSYRLEEARRQLNEGGGKKVTSIAHDAGFKDISTFYRNFRREFGYSPRGSVTPARAGKRKAVGPDIGKDDAARGRGAATARVAATAKEAVKPDGYGEPAPLPRETLFRHRAPGRMIPGLQTTERYRFNQ